MALRILCLLSFLAFSHALILPLFDPRIVNGIDARLGEIPYQVSLQEKNSSLHYCGGSILNDNYVITTARCVDGKITDDIKVVAGTIDLDLDDPKSEHDVEKIITHERYDPFNSNINDIALLKVKTPFKTSPTIGHVPLPPKDFVVKTYDIAVVSGWGTLWRGGPTTNKLQRVVIWIADQNFCKYIYKEARYNVYSTHVCAYDTTMQKGPCHGDFGSPLTVGRKLVGLVSWAMNCASTVYPAVYTNVSSYLDWIKNNAV